jgi:hypothetical protein
MAPWPAKSTAEHDASFARVSSSRSPQTVILAFAGGPAPHTIMSACQGTLLGLLDTASALPLRATCRDAAAAVAAHPWDDSMTFIRGSLAHWRACFRAATAANAACRALPVTDADLGHLAGVRSVSLRVPPRGTWWHCPPAGFTDHGLRALAGCTSLDLSGCAQEGLTGAGLRHLVSCRQLYLWGCREGLCGEGGAAALAAALPSLRFIDGTDPQWPPPPPPPPAAAAGGSGAGRVLVQCGPGSRDMVLRAAQEASDLCSSERRGINEEAPLLVWHPRWTPAPLMQWLRQRGPGCYTLRVHDLSSSPLGCHARAVDCRELSLGQCGVEAGAVLGMRPPGCISGSGGVFKSLFVVDAEAAAEPEQ